MIQCTTDIPDCLVFKPTKYNDNRGFFVEVFNQKQYEIPYQWVQTNCSVNKRGVIRGMHITPFAKLVTCVAGRLRCRYASRFACLWEMVRHRTYNV